MRHLISILALMASATATLIQAQTSPPSNAAQTSNGLVVGWQFSSAIHVLIDGNMFPSGSAASQAIMQGFINDSMAY